ncbi:hypothetical protein [Nonomuraea sp. NPDC049784]|uniref:hypothetical protein n=1 Tax=Nonomuraea sp. NPDC049784 TaxID=3154361 RepID=UPI0033C15391
MTNFEWLTSLVGNAAPPYWAAGGAAATLLTMGLIWGFMRLVLPKRRPPRHRSMANLVTWVCAAAALVISGQGIFEVIHRAAPDVPWLPWLGVFLLEGPLLAFALRAKEAVDQQKDPSSAIRMTWVLASMSAAISATSTLTAGDAGVFLLRAVAPVVGVILWHHALAIELEGTGSTKSQSRWKWTPEYVLTRLGLVTARTTETADAEVHMRLTKVADWVIRYARAAVRNAQTPGWWNTRWNNFARWRLERIYRAAERDLDLVRNTSRRELLEQIIASRSTAVLLTLLAGCTHADLGLPEPERPEQSLEEQARNTTRMLFHTIVKQPRNTPDRNSRNTNEATERNTRNGAPGTGGDAVRNTRATGDRNTQDPERNTSGKPTREEFDAAIARHISPAGEVPIRTLARELGVAPATMSRHADRYRKQNGFPSPSEGVIPPPRSSDHNDPHNASQQLAAVGGGDPN